MKTFRVLAITLVLSSYIIQAVNQKPPRMYLEMFQNEQNRSVYIPDQSLQSRRTQRKHTCWESIRTFCKRFQQNLSEFFDQHDIR